jgi:hypothetical protein
MSNAITITEVEYEEMTFDLATQELDNGDTAYWLIHEGALVVADLADETTAADLAADFDFYWLVLAGLLKVATAERPAWDACYELADHYYDSRF